MVGGKYVHERTQTRKARVGKRVNRSVRFCLIHCAHVEKKVASAAGSILQPFLTQACSVLSGEESKWAITSTSTPSDAASLQTLLRGSGLCSVPFRKLKSLYEYLIGMHMHKLIRKSVLYARSASALSLGCIRIAYTKSSLLESRDRLFYRCRFQQ